MCGSVTLWMTKKLIKQNVWSTRPDTNGWTATSTPCRCGCDSGFELRRSIYVRLVCSLRFYREWRASNRVNKRCSLRSRSWKRKCAGEVANEPPGQRQKPPSKVGKNYAANEKQAKKCAHRRRETDLAILHADLTTYAPIPSSTPLWMRTAAFSLEQSRKTWWRRKAARSDIGLHGSNKT